MLHLRKFKRINPFSGLDPQSRRDTRQRCCRIRNIVPVFESGTQIVLAPRS